MLVWNALGVAHVNKAFAFLGIGINQHRKFLVRESMLSPILFFGLVQLEHVDVGIVAKACFRLETAISEMFQILRCTNLRIGFHPRLHIVDSFFSVVPLCFERFTFPLFLQLPLVLVFLRRFSLSVRSVAEGAFYFYAFFGYNVEGITSMASGVNQDGPTIRLLGLPPPFRRLCPCLVRSTSLAQAPF